MWGGSDEEDGGCRIAVEGVGEGDFGGLETFDVDDVVFGCEKQIDRCRFAVVGARKKIFLGGWDGLLFSNRINEGAGGYEDLWYL